MPTLIDSPEFLVVGPAALLVGGAFVAAAIAFLVLWPALRSLRRDREAERYYERLLARLEREKASHARSDGRAA